ncbi:MAG: NAD(P)-dependent oxidoreductase [Chloroflexi bacterium]|nr:NAD(P)-dependent oxidoreductase [Chloroflexota bacterium]
MRVGLIGLGTMGSRFARRLRGAGYTPLGFDRVEALVVRATAEGSTPAGSVGAVVSGTDVILTSLPMPEDLLDVIHQAAAFARTGQVFVDLSTVDPSTARSAADMLASRGARFLDAPVSGGTTGAEAGTLAVMIGGEATVLDTVRPILSSFAARIVHCGPVGAGSVVKLANQMLVAAHIAAAGEAARFARANGIPIETLLDVVSAATGDSLMFRRTLRDHYLTGDYAPTFALRLLMKDLRLYAAESARAGTLGPVGENARGTYETAMAANLGEEDYAAAIKVLMGEVESPANVLA